MNKSDLLLALQDVGDDEEIFFMFPYGDHCHHMVVKPVEYVDFTMCKWSGYTDSMILDESEDGSENDSEHKWVLS
jgi:hypothetical protein